MNKQDRIKILKQFSSDEYLKQFGENKNSFSLSEDKKVELLEALGPQMQGKDKNTPGGIKLNAMSIKIFCQKILKTLSGEEELKVPEDFEQVKFTFIENQIAHIQKGIQIGDIMENSETLEHTQENKLNYRSGSFEEKWKASFGFDKNFTPHSNIPDKIKVFNQEYLPLNPDKLEQQPALLNFILNGTFKSNKKYGYTPVEKKLLVYEIMKNPEEFKKKILSYESLVIPLEEGYSEEITERIVSYPKGNGEEGNSYLISENTPQKYEEKHLKNYVGNTIRFTPFKDKESAFNYLLDQVSNSIENQIQRLDEFYREFKFITTFPVNKEINELLKNVYNFFSYHKGKADQEIALACAKALQNKNEANRHQIMMSLMEKLPKIKKGIVNMQNTVGRQFEAFRDNKVF